jgi:hypothetical protein
MQSIPVFEATFTSSGDLSAGRYKFVKISAAQTVALTGAGERAIGVLTNAPDAAGKPASVRILGTVEVMCGAAVAAGNLLKSDANGKAINASVANDDFFGIALEAATADGDIIEALLVTGQF